jgi:acyl-CoA reductase-like NAD-dependent aldehyde dehydrogenase
VDELAPNIACVANRIIWSKTLNCGQTCAAPDYVVVHEKHTQQLCDELVRAIQE